MTIPKRLSVFWKPGSTIRGKWHQQAYIIQRKLGSGAVGSVYLCFKDGQAVALKISEKTTSIMMEVNVLKSLAKVQGYVLGPSLLDVDDWVCPKGSVYSFYVMEYIHGENLTSFIRKNGVEWIPVFILQLLRNLEQLHEAGWVFGDLKTENLLVTSHPPRVRWIDVGGTTKIGRSIKEYTAFYDRGYWGMGTRRAEPSYDLFALVMVFLTIDYPQKFAKGPYPKVTLFDKYAKSKSLSPFQHCFKKAMLGKYQTSMEMKRELLLSIQSVENNKNKNHAASSNMLPFIVEFISIGFLSGVIYFVSLCIPG